MWKNWTKILRINKKEKCVSVPLVHVLVVYHGNRVHPCTSAWTCCQWTRCEKDKLNYTLYNETARKHLLEGFFLFFVFANAGWFPVQSVFTCLNWDCVMQGSWRWKFWLNHRACIHVSCFLNCVFLCSHLKPEWDVIDSSVHQSNHWHPASGLYIVSSPPQRRPHSLVDTDVCFMSF